MDAVSVLFFESSLHQTNHGYVQLLWSCFRIFVGIKFVLQSADARDRRTSAQEIKISQLWGGTHVKKAQTKKFKKIKIKIKKLYTN